ncbi:MAG: DNA gyrase subunit A, partial [Carnobacterium alterfunditum]
RIALDHIDEIIRLIRGSKTGDIAKTSLIETYGLSDKQAQAILDMRMVRLTGLERDKIESEYTELMALIADMADILARPERIHTIIETELLEVQEKFGDARRTELLVGEVLSLEDEDLIEEEDIVITLTSKGYIKRLPSSEFKSQRRGGRGIQGMGVHDDDFIETLVSCSTHDTLLFFTNNGKVYRSKGYEIPEYGRTAKGIPVINLLGIDSGETVQAVINVRGESEEGLYLFFTTRLGTVKRTDVKAFSNIRSNGLKAIVLKENDELMSVSVTNGDQNIIIGTHLGYAVSFHENDVRNMGRTAGGVRGIRLRENDYVIGVDLLKEDSEVLIITEKGYGKRTKASEYAIKGRGGKGIKTANITSKNGNLAGLTTVKGDEDIMLITNTGIIIRFSVSAVSQTGRATLGVRVIRVAEDVKVSTMAKVDAKVVDDEIDEAGIVSELSATEDKALNESSQEVESVNDSENDTEEGTDSTEE